MTTRPTKSVTKAYTNGDTGEVVNLTHEEPITSKRGAKGQDYETNFAFVWPENLWQVRLPSRSWQVFWLLLQEVSIETGVCAYSTKHIALALGVPASNISRCITDLVDGCMAQKVGHGKLRLNPHMVWRGKLKARSDALYAMKVANALSELHS